MCRVSHGAGSARPGWSRASSSRAGEEGGRSMAMSDPLGDMLTRIRNGQSARKQVVISPASKLRSNVLAVLKREGFLRGYSPGESRPCVAAVTIELKYQHGQPVLRATRRVSRPGLPLYAKTN